MLVQQTCDRGMRHLATICQKAEAERCDRRREGRLRIRIFEPRCGREEYAMLE